MIFIETINKLLWVVAIILILLSGFKIKCNSFNFEWVGILEIILNWLER